MIRLLLITLLCSGTLAAQQPASCDTLYKAYETGCHYAPGESKLHNFVMRELLSELNAIDDSTRHTITKLPIVMVVDVNGVVSNVRFPGFAGPPEVEEKMRQKVLAMQGWTAGTKNGQPVCTEVTWGPLLLGWK